MGAKSFIGVSLRLDPVKRYSCGELYLHQWIQEQDERGPSVLELPAASKTLSESQLKGGVSATVCEKERQPTEALVPATKDLENVAPELNTSVPNTY